MFKEEEGLGGGSEETGQFGEENGMDGGVEGDPDGRYLRGYDVDEKIEGFGAMGGSAESDDATECNGPAFELGDDVAERHGPANDVLGKVLHKGFARMNPLGGG